jgi:hypothetical protein
MKTLSIAPVVPAFRPKWRITIMPFISIRKVPAHPVAVAPLSEQDRRKVSRPSSNPLNYFLLALTFFYLVILVAGCWAMVQVFWRWTTESSLAGFPVS